MLCNAKCYITFEIKVINRGLLIEASRKVHQKDDLEIGENKQNNVRYSPVNVLSMR